MVYQQGDIVIVPFPFTNLSGTKFRPAIVVSKKSVNRGQDVILAQITTQTVRGHPSVKITNSDVSIPFRPPHSEMTICCKKIAVIEKSMIRKKITKLSDTKMKAVLTLIREMFEFE